MKRWSRYCDDTKSWEPDNRTLTLKGGRTLFIRYGQGKLYFVADKHNGFTKVLVLTLDKKEILSSYYFPPKWNIKKIRQSLFGNATMYDTNKLRIAVAHVFIEEACWNKIFEPNKELEKKKKRDSALFSLSNLFRELNKHLYKVREPSDMYKVGYDHIDNKRKEFLDSTQEITSPIYEAYAFWPNYDPNIPLIRFGTSYMENEPIYYSYNKYESVDDIKNTVL